MDTTISQPFWRRDIFVHRLIPMSVGAVLATIVVYVAMPAHDPVMPIVLAVGLLIGLAVGLQNDHVAAQPNTAEAILLPNQEQWPELGVAQKELSTALQRLAQQTDPILLESAVGRLVTIWEDVNSLANGRIVFVATEAWRTVYDQILRSPGIDNYRSVAWIRNEDYWQDLPGQQSIQTNFDLARHGTSIERILILCDFFWPSAAALPAADIRRWIDDQHKRGITIRLVRESDIAAEADLLCDIGIYGSRAAGTLELDTQCRTTRFTFDFSPEGIRLAEERWKRLSLFTISYADILDRNGRHA